MRRLLAGSRNGFEEQRTGCGLGGHVGERAGEGERAATFLVALRFHGGTVRVAEAAHQGKPHAHAAVTARAAVVLLVETVEEKRNGRGADPETVVHDVDSAPSRALDRTRADAHMAVLRRELHGVVDERAEHLAEAEW